MLRDVTIPAMWLVGRMQARMLEGHSARAARVLAHGDWYEQERLEQQWLRERKEG